MESKHERKDTSRVIQTLTKDALALLPENLRRRVQEEITKHSQDITYISPTYIASRIYDVDQTRDVKIPEMVYYDGFKTVGNIESRIEEGKKGLTNSEKLYRDQYNMALGLLVNWWLTGFRKSKVRIRMPKEGVYLRDSTGELYLHEEA